MGWLHTRAVTNERNHDQIPRNTKCSGKDEGKTNRIEREGVGVKGRLVGPYMGAERNLAGYWSWKWFRRALWWACGWNRWCKTNTPRIRLRIAGNIKKKRALNNIHGQKLDGKIIHRGTILNSRHTVNQQVVDYMVWQSISLTPNNYWSVDDKGAW